MSAGGSDCVETEVLEVLRVSILEQQRTDRLAAKSVVKATDSAAGCKGFDLYVPSTKGTSESRR